MGVSKSSTLNQEVTIIMYQTRKFSKFLRSFCYLYFNYLCCFRFLLAYRIIFWVFVIFKMSIHSFRANDKSEYQDHMDISECIPSIKVSNLSLTWTLQKEQVIPDFSDFLTQRGCWVRSLFSKFFYLFRTWLYDPIPLISFCIVIFRGMMHYYQQFPNSVLLLDLRVVCLRCLKDVLVPLQIL